MNEFEKTLFEGLFRQKIAKSSCNFVKLPRPMKPLEAMDYVLDYSGKRGTECGFAFNRMSDDLWYFVEGRQDCVAIPTGGFAKGFHTHPTEAKSCLPSIDDIIHSNAEVFIGCPKRNEIVSFSKTGTCWASEVRPLVETAKDTLTDYAQWKEHWTDAIKHARQDADFDHISSLEFESVQKTGTLKSFMNMVENFANEKLRECNLLKKIK